MSNNGAAGQRNNSEKSQPSVLPDLEENGSRKKPDIEIREMGVDDIPAVFHLGEQVFTADKTPTLYRTWDEFEVISIFNEDTEYCLVAEVEGQIIGFAMGNGNQEKICLEVWLPCLAGGVAGVSEAGRGQSAFP